MPKKDIIQFAPLNSYSVPKLARKLQVMAHKNSVSSDLKRDKKTSDLLNAISYKLREDIPLDAFDQKTLRLFGSSRADRKTQVDTYVKEMQNISGSFKQNIDFLRKNPDHPSYKALLEVTRRSARVGYSVLKGFIPYI
jgi:hypothetical protein